MMHIPVNAEKSTCRGCGGTIFWVTSFTGRRIAVNPDGTSHFFQCAGEMAPAKRKTREAAHV